MITLKSVKERMESDVKNRLIHLMDFVDDFRYYKDPSALQEPFSLGNGKTDALLAGAVECLCDELGIPCPEWIGNIPACKDPWFLSEMENMKAIALAESPLPFRMRKIFVLENFLSRV